MLSWLVARCAGGWAGQGPRAPPAQHSRSRAEIRSRPAGPPGGAAARAQPERCERKSEVREVESENAELTIRVVPWRQEPVQELERVTKEMVP